jgi:type I restriction enzyme R subunit
VKTDTSEKGLESVIVDGLVANGWIQGDNAGFLTSYAIDVEQLRAFLAATQPDLIDALDLDHESTTRHKALSRIQGEITKRGIVDVLRKGIKHGADNIDLFYATPTPGNIKAAERFAANRFSVTRQFRYSPDETQLALDLGLFINGLPVATAEVKNLFTRQNVTDAIAQYQTDRSPKELVFQFKRCLVHFAIDDAEVEFCTKLEEKESWFLPFNQGHDQGAGNPPNQNGQRTSYLWEKILAPARLTNIIEHYAQVVTETDPATGKKIEKQIFPRYHQLDVVLKLLEHAEANGPGHKYLNQHSAGSGKSNSISWLAHQLVGLGTDEKPVFDSVLIVTDRRQIDRQIRDTVKQFAQVSATVGHAKNSNDLRRLLGEGKKIIITTIQKFPFIVDSIGDEHRDRSFAIIIDEAHSSQGGTATAKMSEALGPRDETEEEPDFQDLLNQALESRKMLDNASYFAFTATPKNKTLQLFGEPYTDDEVTKYKPFHLYSMKQAIQERFILDVLKHYTPVSSYYKLMKTVEDDPEFDSTRAQAKLRRYVEGHDHAIATKAGIIVDHFLNQVYRRRLVGGQARAMVAASNIRRALDYYMAIKRELQASGAGIEAIVAFTGEPEYGGETVSESKLNGFSTNEIPDRIKTDPYRILVVADKFQTGYDEPLLQTMYVDKPLTDIRAVQTLSRLNRTHPAKGDDVFVLDFYNDAENIKEAFSDYYQTTILSEETDPNKLHDLQATLEGHQVCSSDQVDAVASSYLRGVSRSEIDPILDACADAYTTLDADAQIEFKSAAKGFTRTYKFLAAVLPYGSIEWEKLSIFLDLLIPKLPSPEDDDYARGIVEAIDMESYRAEKRAAVQILLEEEDAEIGPVPVGGAFGKPEVDLDPLSVILAEFNDLFGNIPWKDGDRVFRRITEELPERLTQDKRYQNAVEHSDEQNVRVELDQAIRRIMAEAMSDDSELFKQFSDNPEFQHFVLTKMLELTFTRPESSPELPTLL